MAERRAERRSIMGMPVAVLGAERAATERVFAWLRAVDARFSTYRRDSEISRLGRGELALRDAHPDVREVLARCEALRLETDGYFDAGLDRVAAGPVGPGQGLGGGPCGRAARRGRRRALVHRRGRRRARARRARGASGSAIRAGAAGSPRCSS